MKRTIIFFVLLTLSLAGIARPVSQDVARRVAQTWLQAQGMKNPAALQDITAQTPFTEFYVFAAPEGGFALVSGDDCVKPVLAYSVNNRFVAEDMPANIRSFLEGYEREIRWWKRHSSRDIPTSPLQVAGVEKESSLPGAWRELLDGAVPPPVVSTAVAPLMTTTWNQSPYYNALCPTNGGDAERAVTGCVATATAQVMKYHNHPATGYGSHTYSSSRTVDGTQYTYNNLTANFGATTYQWSQMPNALTSASTTAQVNAVATLMYHIGVADEMAYSPVASGANNAYSSSMKPTSQASLMQYFKYRPDMANVERGFYSDAEYCALLRSELDQQRPILYSGRDESGGHSFVLDGYDNNGYFHVNWGWGGSNDDYYTIGALNPGAGGTGGNATYTFNLDNSVLIGIRPNTAWSTTGTTTVTGSMQSGSPAGSSVTVYNRTSGASASSFAFGDTVVLRASLPEGYRFNGWTDGSTSNPREIYANGGSYSFSAKGVAIGGGDTVAYCNGSLLSLSPYTGGVKLPASALDATKQMTSIMFYAYTAGTYNFTVYTGSSHETTAATASYTVSAGDEDAWHTVELATPVAATSDIWILISSDDSGVYPVSLTNYSGVPSSLLLSPDGTIYEYGEYWQKSAMVKGVFSSVVEVSGDTVSYCGNNAPVSSVGNANGGTFQWGVMFPAGTLNNNYLKSVMLNVRSDQTGNYTLNVYRGGDTVPGTLAHTQTVTFTAGGWQEAQLDAAFALGNENIWVTFTATGTYMMTVCDYTGAPNSNWINNGGTWAHITDFGLNYSWLIKAVLSATPASSYPPPAIAISGQQQLGKGMAYTFTATATEGASVSWSLQGATPATATGATATATWNTTGLYRIIATATNAYGTGSDTMWVNVVDYTVGDTVSYVLDRQHYTNVGAGGNDFGWGIMMPSAFLTGRTHLYGVMAVVAEPGTYTLNVYQGGSDAPQTQIGTYTLNVTDADTASGHYMTYTFPTPLAISSASNLWVAILSTGMDYPAGSVPHTTDPNSDWTYYNNSWSHLPQLGLNYSWEIKLLMGQSAAPQSYTVTAASNNAAWGTVSGGGTYQSGATATLTATANSGYHFVQWQDGNTQNPRTVTVTANVTYTATFAADAAPQTGDTCAITALPYTMDFENGAPCWSLRDNNQNDTTWGIIGTYGYNGSRCAYAIYQAQADDWLMTPRVAVTGTHTVSWKTRVMSANYPETYQVWAMGNDTSVMIFSETLTDTLYVDRMATFTVPAGDSVSVMWRYVSANMYALFLDDVTISQGVAQYTITANSSNAAWGTVSGGGTYSAGATATLTATAAAGYHFVQWQDGNMQNPRTVTVTGNATYTATFASDASCAVTSFPWTEGFEGGIGACWSTIDNNSDGYGWEALGGFGNNSSSYSAASYSYVNGVGALTPDNWLVSPAIVVPATGSYDLSWAVSASNNDYPEEHYAVYVATAKTVAAFTATTAVYEETLTAAQWATRTVSLAAYAGQTVYVAFRHYNCTDQYFMAIDDVTITAGAAPQYTVTAVSNNAAWGTVTGGGTYNAGATVTLTATPASGYRFVSWQDGSTQNPRTVTVTANATYIATFEAIPPTQYTLTVVSNNAAWGTVTGGGTYNAGATVTLTATPASGYRFVSWQDGSTQNPRTVTVTANATYIATFEAIPPTQYTITVMSNNDSWGTVSGGGTYNAGSMATLTPIPAAGYRFVSWQDGNTENPRVFTVTQDATFIATFESSVGIDGVETAAVAIAPNPATEYAVVNGLKAGSEVAVVDINGKMRLSGIAQSDMLTLDVSGLSAGVYFVRVSDGAETAVRKLIVK